MQLEATDWSIRPTLVVHPQGFTPIYLPVALNDPRGHFLEAVRASAGRGLKQAHLGRS